MSEEFENQGEEEIPPQEQEEQAAEEQPETVEEPKQEIDIQYLQMSDDEIDKLTAADITEPEQKKEEVQKPVQQSFSEEQEKPQEQPKPEAKPQQVNNEEIVKAIFSPFKANGKELQVDSVEDVRSLMQMGANYNKKMAGLKPYLKVVKILENNGLLDEAKLNHLIDISRKDPKALAKAVADSGHDLMDLGSTDVSDYRPNTYGVTDEEMALESVLSEIRETPSYKDTLTIVNTKWDAASRKAVLTQPEALRAINDHVSTGLYQQIMDIVEQERILGRLSNLSDLDAYKHVGQVLHKAGAFNQQPQRQAPVKPVIATKQPSPQQRSAKAAAGIPTKGAVQGSKLPANFNPLSLSDAEFEKLASQKLY